ncbi:MAG: hypothetical protein RR328_07410, partial [Bacteroidales bacterium]
NPKNAASYQIRLKYRVGAVGSLEKLTDFFTITFSPLPVAGTLSSSKADLCMGENPSQRATLLLRDQEGSIQKWEFSKTEDFASPTDKKNENLNYLDVIANSADSGWYRVQVGSANCAAVASKPVLIHIRKASVAGNITSTNSPICFGQAVTLTLANQVGDINQWMQSIDGGTTYTAIANTTSTQTTNITQRTLFKTQVQNTGVCQMQESSPITIEVYDTVKITKQPHNTMGSISAKAVFAVEVENAGIPQASSISAFAFTWQYKIHNQGAWLDLPQKIQDTCVNTSSKNQTHTSTLSLPYAFFAGSNGEDTLNRYRCLITPKTPVCSEDQQISEEVKASKVPPFYAGVLHTLMGTDPGRLYYTDSMATFFVKDYTGNKVSFDWFIYNGTTETPLTQANFPEFIKLSPKQDTLYLTAAKKLFNGSNILRVYVQDDV